MPHAPGESWDDEPWNLCKSSNVAAFRRAGVNGHELQVWFNNGAVYEYIGAGELYDSMASASSKGKFVWVHLRSGYLYNKISVR